MLKKKIVLLIVVVLLANLFVFATVNATTELDSVKIDIGAGQRIIKLADGRIKPINPQVLSQEQRAIVLKEMGFNELDLKEMPDDIAISIIKNGGKKVELNLLDFHVSSNLPENDSSDVGIYNVTTPIFTQWSVYIDIVNNGTSYYYDFYSKYEWTNYTNTYYKDITAMAWENDYTVHAGVGGYVAKYYLVPNWYDVWKYVDLSSVYGTSMTFDMKYAQKQYGYIRERIFIPISRGGSQGVFAWRYGHSALPGTPSASIGPLSISFSGLSGTEWSGRYGFTIGQ
ncbi:MAG: hypothetical protein KGZ63_11280 [Clostridiales bacterium]|jgi:hypothetical protein|nr:hypothetical protein [Clostridiales bacterium]